MHVCKCTYRGEHGGGLLAVQRFDEVVDSGSVVGLITNDDMIRSHAENTYNVCIYVYIFVYTCVCACGDPSGSILCTLKGSVVELCETERYLHGERDPAEHLYT